MGFSAREMGPGGEPVVFFSLPLGCQAERRQTFTHFSVLSRNLKVHALKPLRQHLAPGCVSCLQFARQVEICKLTPPGYLLSVRRGARDFASVPVLFSQQHSVIKQCYFIISDEETEIKVV